VNTSSRPSSTGSGRGHAPRERGQGPLRSRDQARRLRRLIPRVLEEELRSLGLHPVNVPVLKDLKHEDGQPLRCAAAFEIIPEFELPDYRTVRVKSRKAEVSGEDIAKALEDLRARAAEYVPVEGRGVGNGDYVVVEMQGRTSGPSAFCPSKKPSF